MRGSHIFVIIKQRHRKIAHMNDGFFVNSLICKKLKLGKHRYLEIPVVGTLGKHTPGDTWLVVESAVGVSHMVTA